MKNKLLILTFFMAAYGCGKSQVSSIAPALITSNIIGGSAVVESTVFSKRTVGLFNKNKNTVCTGAIIEEDLILTAAHCVFKAETSDIQISFGARLNDDKNPAYIAHKIFVHSGYNDQAVANDLALIRLSKKIPSTHEVLDLEDSRQLHLEKNDLVTSLGFGVTKTGVFSGNGGRGILRMTTIPVMKYGVSQAFIYLDQTAGKGICYGDSGGPTFTIVNNKVVLVGIASHVSMDEKTKRSQECLNMAVLSNPNYFYDWIELTKLKI